MTTIYPLDASGAGDIFAVAAVISSLFVITSKNPVISVLFLISVFVNSAVYLMFLGISFIGISYIIVYVGAIAILFLFILMMINIKLTDILEVGTDYTKNLPLALIIGVLFLVTIFTSTPSITMFTTSRITSLLHVMNSAVTRELNNVNMEGSSVDSYLIDYTQIESIGHNLYTTSAFLLILTSIILLLSMLAPIMLSSFYKKFS